MARTKKPAARYTVVLDPDITIPVARAASLWSCVAKSHPERRVSGIATVPETFELTDEQRDLMVRFGYLCQFIDRRSPSVTFFICPTCEQWFVSIGTSRSGAPCKLTFGCPGRSKKVDEATRQPIEPEDPQDDIPEDTTEDTTEDTVDADTVDAADSPDNAAADADDDSAVA